MSSLEEQLRSKLLDKFSQDVLTGALLVVGDGKNPIRISQFSSAVRELFNYSLHFLAPDEQVTKCDWFVLEANTKTPTRRQRAKYATQGGLSDEYIEGIGVDVEHLHDEALAAINEVNKFTHIRPETVTDDQTYIDDFANSAMHALLLLLSTFEHCRDTIVRALVDEINDEAVNVLITDTIDSVDELATHHSVEAVYVENMRVTSITHDEIQFEVEGTLSVGLQWGSNSDIRSGEGAELDQDFPFHVRMVSPVSDPAAFYDVTYQVDTSKWSNGDRE